MGIEIIIAAIALLIVVIIGSALWIRKNIGTPADASVIDELNQKRDLAAQVPLLNQNIDELNEKQRAMLATVDDLKNRISEKEIALAEGNKDRAALTEKIGRLTEAVAAAHADNEALKESEKALNASVRRLESDLDKKTHASEQSAIAARKDLERSNAKIMELQEALESKKTELAAHKSAIEKQMQENSTLKAEKSELSADLAALRKSSAETKTDLQQQIRTLKEESAAAGRKIETLLDELKEINAERSMLQANLEAQQANNRQLKKDFEEQSKKLELKLNEIMQQNLESKLKKFDETSMKSLDGLLKPFKENLDTFKKKVEDSQENSTKKFAELSKEIEQVTKAGLNISKEAENLTKALKGKKQTQGSWGEMILESVLEYSGLRKGEHYETQESYRDAEGKTKRPDVVIKLPQERTIIIDSKVSLNDYDRYIRAETDEERTLAAKGIATAFRNHIDTLDSKDYAHYKVGTLQYVFMFVPIEGAFAMAVQQDPDLYEYALKKHIAIVNPSTLTVSLRTIYLYWQSEQSSSLASKLFDEAGKLYDKMVGFADNFNRLGNQIKTLNNTYDQANRQLTEGRGNLMHRAENLKRLGAKTSKSLTSAKIEYQDFDESNIEVEVIEEDSDQPLTLEKPE